MIIQILTIYSSYSFHHEASVCCKVQIHGYVDYNYILYAFFLLKNQESYTFAHWRIVLHSVFPESPLFVSRKLDPLSNITENPLTHFLRKSSLFKENRLSNQTGQLTDGLLKSHENGFPVFASYPLIGTGTCWPFKTSLIEIKPKKKFPKHLRTWFFWPFSFNFASSTKMILPQNLFQPYHTCLLHTYKEKIIYLIRCFT